MAACSGDTRIESVIRMSPLLYSNSMKKSERRVFTPGMAKWWKIVCTLCGQTIHFDEKYHILRNCTGIVPVVYLIIRLVYQEVFHVKFYQ